MRIALKGSKGTTLELSASTWAEAMKAAQKHGWRWNQNTAGEQVIQAAEATRMATALKKAGVISE